MVPLETPIVGMECTVTKEIAALDDIQPLAEVPVIENDVVTLGETLNVFPFIL